MEIDKGECIQYNAKMMLGKIVVSRRNESPRVGNWLEVGKVVETRRRRALGGDS